MGGGQVAFAENLILAGSVLASVSGFAALAWKLFGWVARQKRLEEQVAALKRQTCEAEDSLNEEQSLIVYGLLACLKGLQELECDGPVTEAIARFDEHLNKKAHNLNRKEHDL